MHLFAVSDAADIITKISQPEVNDFLSGSEDGLLADHTSICIPIIPSHCRRHGQAIVAESTGRIASKGEGEQQCCCRG